MYYVLCLMHVLRLKGFHPARLDLHESGVIGKAFKRSFTATGFGFFLF
jgi:hypothetical protein